MEAVKVVLVTGQIISRLKAGKTKRRKAVRCRHLAAMMKKKIMKKSMSLSLMFLWRP